MILEIAILGAAGKVGLIAKQYQRLFLFHSIIHNTATFQFTPDLSCCEGCKHVFEEKDSFWLDVMNGSLLCAECRSKAPTAEAQGATVGEYETRNVFMPLDAPSLMAMRYCISAPTKRLFSFSIKDESSAELFYRAAEAYLLNHLERGFETLNFYYKIKD